mmetsp:Transcript_16542/g.24130  ORF Transcript_16542/g.24130 Transcript_16542/m.24130 type:complete len:91 (-) Transcript_16542:94-366(-)
MAKKLNIEAEGQMKRLQKLKDDFDRERAKAKQYKKGTSAHTSPTFPSDEESPRILPLRRSLDPGAVNDNPETTAMVPSPRPLPTIPQNRT